MSDMADTMATSSAWGPKWPALPLRDWNDTYAALHMRAQIIGKTRLARAPAENHWWHCALYVTPHGLTTGPMPDGERTFEIQLDLLEDQLTLRTSDAAFGSMRLGGQSVAEFYSAYLALLSGAGIDVHIWPVPVEVSDPVPFAEDDNRASDADATRRCFQALVQIDRVLRQFRGDFLGKCSPSHFWWGAFDIACTRFSGRRAPRHPGGIPGAADFVTVEAYSHECISAGWWPGNMGGAMEEPAFYAYAYPEPDGCATAPIQPAAAHYHPTLREWILPYDAVRLASDPDRLLLEFLHSTYDTAARLGGWSPDLVRSEGAR
ncbi:MAG: DUF5996 family protein [Longimicrobiales bacterium]